MINAPLGSERTFLHRLDARTKLAGMLIIFGLTMAFTDPVYIFVLLLVVLFGWGAARISFGQIRTVLQYFLGIAVIIFVIQAFFYPGVTPLLWISKPVPAIGFSGFISREGILFAFAMVMRLVVIMLVAPLLAVTTTIPDLMLALVKMKIPYRFAFVMTTAMSLLPSIQNRSELIQQAQLCRGVAGAEGGKIWQKLRAKSGLLVPLILGSFRDSQTLDVAMSSRAFGAPVKRTFLQESALRAADYLMLAIFALAVVAATILRVFGFGSL